MHGVLSIVLWITFVFYWRIVLRRGVEQEVVWAVFVLGLFLIFQLATTYGWIQHNRRLSRKYRARRQERTTPPPFPVQDFHGKRIEAYPGGESLGAAAHVWIHSGEASKRFSAGFSLRDPSIEGKDGDHAEPQGGAA